MQEPFYFVNLHILELHNNFLWKKVRNQQGQEAKKKKKGNNN